MSLRRLAFHILTGSYHLSMAVPARRPDQRKNLPSVPEAKLTPVQSLAAQLMGQGYRVPQVAERMVDYIVQNSRRNRATRLKMARTRLRRWAKTEEFRAAMHDTAIIQLDLDSPLILQGISKKARAGRVDAARLALELTQRHVPKGDPQPAHVEVIFEGLPRPQRLSEQEKREDYIDGELAEEESDADAK